MPIGYQGQGAHLEGHDGDDGLGVHKEGVAQVVKAALGEDLGAGLEPHRLAEGDGVGQQLRGDAPQRAEHGPAGMDDLDLAVLGKGLRVGGEASGVPACSGRRSAGQRSRQQCPSLPKGLGCRSCPKDVAAERAMRVAQVEID
jgi:hypothetical protein